MRRSPILALSLFVSGSLFFAACTQDFGIFGSGQTGTGGGTTTSTTSTTGGTGGVGGCSANSDCNDTNPCTDDTCNTATGKCTNAAVADGPVPGMSDTAGDCKKSQCTAGKMETVADDADKPSNMDPCVTKGCDMGTVTTTNVADGTSCGMGPQKCDGMGNCVGCKMDNDCPAVGDCQLQNCDMNKVCSPIDKAPGMSCATGGNVCDGAGVCVECLDDNDCNGTDEVCNAMHTCVSSCGDGMTNGKETDQDCGGPCDPCGTGKNCTVTADCDSKVCTGGAQKTCKAPACDDNVTNGAETDQDCGGATCPKCADGDKCMVGADCTSGHCTGGLCIPQCADGVKDGTETDIDCGGTCTANCALGKGCLVGGDCVSTFCNATTKLCVVQCADGVKQANEADIDCGGAGCAATKCADGKSCTLATDCTSGFCNAMMKCAAPTCTDMEKNATETDVDCGGACVTKCANTKSCVLDADCASTTCIATVCYPATCKNTAKDGTETDVDCGGGACPKCALTKDCLVNSDCASGNCNAGSMKCM